jgi:hypothetical protein
MDIDCGPGKPFPTQVAGVVALKKFLKDTLLPPPLVESSGNGLYVHWVLDEAIDPQRWKVVGQKLKALAKHHKFEIDPVRTADNASVLRPMGVHNRKDPLNPKLTRIIFDAPNTSFSAFTAAVTAASARVKIPLQGLIAPKEFKGLNDAFASGIGDNHPPSSAHKVADKCRAARVMRDTLGNIAEPVWYDLLGVLRHCEEGDDVVQEWSSGHPDYSPAATEEKLEHHKASGVGPTTCQKIGADDATLCVGCPHAGKIKSPIVLGYPDAELVATITEEEQRSLPQGFLRTEDGLFIDFGGAPERFYPEDLYPVSIGMDHSKGYEVVTIRHRLPITGLYHEFNVRSALLLKPADFLMAMADEHVQVQGNDSRKHMMSYMDQYMAQLRATRRMNDIYTQMGWTEHPETGDLAFVLGDQIYRADEEPVKGGMSKLASAAVAAFHQKGNLETWKASTRHLSAPGMESLAFSFAAEAFGAPLMRFTGHSGALIAMVGATGLGKTMTGSWGLSTYGKPGDLVLQKDDTAASVISRLGIYGSLPAYIDEVSNMTPEALSDLVYRVTQGKDRNRLTQTGVERGGRTSWNTLAVVSSNHPLTDKLAALKTDSSAELNRILELTIPTTSVLGSATWAEIHNAVTNNYGQAGPIYIQYLVDHQAEHAEKLRKLITELERRTDALQAERFWIAAAAVAIYGGLIAKKLGLIEMNIGRMIDWIVALIRGQRETKNDLVASDLDLLGQFLDHNAAGILVTGRDLTSGMVVMLKEPRGAINGRVYWEENKLFISRQELRGWLAKNFASYTALKNYLISVGALVSTDRRKVLGAGTHYAGSSVPCWEIDLSMPALGRVAAKIVPMMAEPIEGLRRVK